MCVNPRGYMAQFVLKIEKLSHIIGARESRDLRSPSPIMAPDRPYSCSRHWTGTSLQWRLMRGNIIKKRLMSFAFEKIPRVSLTCKLVPVQYREYKYGLFKAKPINRDSGSLFLLCLGGLFVVFSRFQTNVSVVFIGDSSSRKGKDANQGQRYKYQLVNGWCTPVQ